MNIIDVFSGAGGLSEGFRDFDFNILAHVEMDKDAILTLKTREAYHYLRGNKRISVYNEYLLNKLSRKNLYNEVPSHSLNKVIEEEISNETLSSVFEKIDTIIQKKQIHGIIGGPPCQAYSTIGRARNFNKKAKDKRIYLYKHYIEFLKKYSPKFFIFENVRGLLSFKDFYGDSLLEKILSEFDEAGYDVQLSLINSSDYGVPQNRKRLFLFGYKKSYDNIDFFKELEKLKENPITINELFDDLPFMNAGEMKNNYSEKSKSRYINKYIRNENSILTSNMSRPNNKNDLEIYEIAVTQYNEGRRLTYDKLPEKHQTHKNTDSFKDRFKVVDGNSISHTVVAHIAKDGHYYIHPDIKQNRSITVREAARIQTFHDSYYFEGSRTSAFRQIGNAVPPLLSKKIAKSISLVNQKCFLGEFAGLK